MVDCNQGWRMSHDDEQPWTLKDAVPVARELERLGVYWMEEPLHRGDRKGMRALREMVGCADRRRRDEPRALRVPRPDRGALPRCAAARRGADRRHHRAAPRRADGGGGGPGLHAAHLVERLAYVANAHFTCGIANAPFLEFPFDPPEWSLERRDFMLTEAPDVDADGMVVLSEKPGFGVELDEARLTATRIG